jgi:hypothetical protein
MNMLASHSAESLLLYGLPRLRIRAMHNAGNLTKFLRKKFGQQQVGVDAIHAVALIGANAQNGAGFILVVASISVWIKEISRSLLQPETLFVTGFHHLLNLFQGGSLEFWVWQIQNFLNRHIPIRLDGQSKVHRLVAESPGERMREFLIGYGCFGFGRGVGVTIGVASRTSSMMMILVLALSMMLGTVVSLLLHFGHEENIVG